MNSNKPISISLNFDSISESLGYPKTFHDPSYFKGFDSASKWRKIFMRITSTNEINGLMKEMEQALITETI